MPRRNPDTSRPAPIPVRIGATTDELRAALGREDLAAMDSAPAMGPRIHDLDDLPDDAAPGDVVTEHGERVGIVGRNGRNEVVVVWDPNPMHDRLRRPRTPITQQFGPAPAAHQPLSHGPADLSRIDLGRTPDGAIIPLPEELRPAAPSVIAAMQEGLARVNTQTEAMRAAVTNVGSAINPSQFATVAANISAATAAMTGAAERQAAHLNEHTYAGPRMLATIAVATTGAAERFSTHTRTPQAAAERAEVEYRQRTRYAIFRRRAEEPVTANIVDRNASHVERFLISAYGMELNEEALTAVTAMTTVITRAAVEPMKARAQAAEAAAAEFRRRAERAEGALAREAQTAREPLSPRVEALTDAVAAAKAWKQTGIEDSVAKRDSFLTLLTALERLAQ